MSVLVQYLKFLKSSPGENEKKEKTAELPGYAPSVAGSIDNEKKDEDKLTSSITDHGLASQETPKNINASSAEPVAMRSSSSAAAPAFTQPVANPGRGYNTGVPRPQTQQQPTKIPRVLEHIPMANSVTDPRSGTLLDKQGSLGYSRNTGISDVEGEIYVNSSDVELLGKLGFDYSCEEYLGLEKTSEVLDVYSYIEKVAGVPKEVAKLIDAGQAFSGEYLKDMGYSVPKGYEVKGDLVCPVEKTEQSFQQTGKEEKGSSEKTAAANPAQTILITGHSGSGKTTLSRQLAEKLACSVKEAKGRCWEGYEPVPGKEAYSEDSCRPKGEKKKEVKKEAEMSSSPTLSKGGPLSIATNPINIPTENLAQQNPPSLGTIANEVSVGPVGLLPMAATAMTKKVAPFVPANLRNKLTRFNTGANIGAGEVNAAQRKENNDNTGKWIDRAGAVGGAMSAIPNPMIAVPGAILSAGASAVNTGRDIQKVREKYSGPPILGGDKPAFPSFNSSSSTAEQQPVQILDKKSAADHPVNSSNIKAVGYDKPSRTLEIAFHSGGEYKYKDVPKSLFDRIKKVKSPGKFLNKHVKKKELPYEKVEKEAGFRVPKGKIPLNHPELLPGMAEHMAKQPFNRAENAFAQGRMSKALRDSILSGRRAEEVKPAFEKMLEHIRNIQ